MLTAHQAVLSDLAFGELALCPPPDPCSLLLTVPSPEGAAECYRLGSPRAPEVGLSIAHRVGLGDHPLAWPPASLPDPLRGCCTEAAPFLEGLKTSQRPCRIPDLQGSRCPVCGDSRFSPTTALRRAHPSVPSSSRALRTRKHGFGTQVGGAWGPTGRQLRLLTESPYFRPDTYHESSGHPVS